MVALSYGGPEAKFWYIQDSNFINFNEDLHLEI